MKATYCHLLSLGALSLGALVLHGCAVQQPMARSNYTPAQNEQPERPQPLSMFAAKRVRAKPAPQALVVAEPAPELQAAAEITSAVQPQAAPSPEPQPQVAAEPAPKQRGPLTNAEESEIDTQVMP